MGNLFTHYNHYYVINHTSSTAQGGGGSFKNRKPIGEVGHGRANPLMDRQVVGVVFFGMVAMVAVATLPKLLDVVWCSAVVVAVAVVAVVVV